MKETRGDHREGFCWLETRNVCRLKTSEDASVLMNGVDTDELYISDGDNSRALAASNDIYNLNNGLLTL